MARMTQPDIITSERTPSTRLESATLRAQISDLAAAQLAASGVPGANVAVLLADAPPLALAVGSADLADEQPLATEATTFIYSITKSLLATLTLQLVDADRLSLDDAVQQHLPWLAERVAMPFSVRQLLQHTAGLPDYGPLPAYSAALRADPTQPWDDETFLDRTLPLAAALDYPPGTGWNYSNIGYLLVRRLLETATGMPLAALVQTHLADPLGLRHTQVVSTLHDTLALTAGYSSALNADAADDTLRDVRGRYAPGWVAHGVVSATALETALLLDAITDPASGLLSAAALGAMTTPHVLPFSHPFFTQPAYGLGLMIDPAAPHAPIVGHGGGGPGYSLGALHTQRPDGRRVTVAVAANADRGDIGLPLAHQILTLLTVAGADTDAGTVPAVSATTATGADA